MTSRRCELTRTTELAAELVDACSRMMIALLRSPSDNCPRHVSLQPQVASRVDVRSCGSSRHGQVCNAGSQHRRFCSTASGGRGAKHRTEARYGMLLTGEPIDAATALSWGLSTVSFPKQTGRGN